MAGRLRFNMEKDLQLIIGLSVLQIFTVAFLPDTPIRTLIGVPLVLFFPGYALVCALFPKKKDLEIVERAALSIGLSLAVVPLIGLALNYSPWGIRLFPTILSLCLFTLLMSIAASYRRRRLPFGEVFIPSVSVKVPRWRELSKWDKVLAAGLVVCIVVAGGFTAYFASVPRVGERFTEFYLLNSEGMIGNYPINLTLGESGTVILGVVNLEYENVNYRIVIRLDNETVETMDNILLGHEMKWEQNYTYTPEITGDKMKLEFLLFKDSVDESYKSLQLWITVWSLD